MKKLKKWFKRIFLGALVLGIAGWLTLVFLLRHWTAKPPPLPADVSITRQQPVSRDGKTWLGQCWVTRREGLLVVRLKGAPFDMGYASGRLLQDQMRTLENEFLDLVHSYVPQDWKVRLLEDYITFRNRRLSDFIPTEYRLQIYGTTLGCPDPHPAYGDYYNRMLNYHAAHDISYLLIDNPLVSRAGCTAFGAWGAATAEGHLITGRNFDWEAAEVFSRDRVVILCEPDGGIPFVSVAWAGMAGVVSGMNRAGVSVTINGAPSELPGDTATPVAMVARDVLQKAHDLKEALAIVRSAKVFVSTHWLIGSRADGKFIVVEKSPEATNIREPEGNTLVCANHFQTPGLKDSERNRRYELEATSLSRDQRMTELLRESRGRITPPRAAEMLRDRKLPGGDFPGNGHRATINPLIATHSTIMDLTAGIFWAASPPNQLGKFVAFDVNDFDREMPELTVSADPMLASGEYERARQAQKKLTEGQRAMKTGNAATALASAEEAAKLNPGFYQTALLRARALKAQHRDADAAAAFSEALAEHPAFLVERQECDAAQRGGTAKTQSDSH